MSKLFLIAIIVIVLLVAGLFIIPVPPDPGEVESVSRVRITVEPPADFSGETTTAGLLAFLGIRGPSAASRPDVGTTFSNITSTGFASSPYQTDASPCRTAAGNYVRPGTVASNFLPMGTILAIKVGGRTLPGVFIVEDRMAKRFSNRIDIWFAQTSQALDFGKQNIAITVVGYGQPGQTLGQSEEIEVQAAEEDEPLWEGVRERISVIARLITTRGTDVNRFDVDCLRLQQEELDI